MDVTVQLKGTFPGTKASGLAKSADNYTEDCLCMDLVVFSPEVLGRDMIRNVSFS